MSVTTRRMRVALSLGIAAALVGAALPAQSQILDAVSEQNLDALRTLLDQGADVNEARGDGLTALHLAAEAGNVEIVELLISASANVDAHTRVGAYAPLHLASQGGHAGVVEALLAAGADPAATTSNSGATALHFAAGAIGGEAVVAALLEHGADANAREGSMGQTPLMFAAGLNRAAAVRVLLEAGADPGISTDVVDVLRSLALDQEANRRLRDAIEELEANAPDGQPRASDVQAAIAAQREFLRSGYDVGDVDAHSLANVGSDFPGGPEVIRPPFREVVVGVTGGMTALLHAAREGHIEAVVALLDGGANIDQVSADGTSPLLIAALNGRFDLAMVLLEHGADPKLASHTEGSSPLFAVLQTQWSPQSNYPQPRAQEEQETRHIELLAALLEAGADPNVRLNTHLWFWEYGLNKMGLDLTGATPFYRAAFAQDLEAMTLLVAYGADPHIPTIHPEVGMRDRRQQDGRQQEDSALPFIPEGEPNAWPLHAAAGGGYIGLGAFSVRNTPDQFLPAVRYLVEEHGADVNLSDSWGYRPIHYAAARGDNELIAYLVEKGADVTLLTRLGQSPADMARGGQGGFFLRVAYPETVAYLTSLGSPLVCLNTHFLDTGDVCPMAGAYDLYGNEPPQQLDPTGGSPLPQAAPRPVPYPSRP